MKEKLKNRIAELRAKLDDEYILSDIKTEIEGDIEILLKLQHAMYFY